MYRFDEDVIMDGNQNERILSAPAVICVKPMCKKELEMVFTWSAKEGWNPGKYEAEAFYAINPNGYMLLTINNVPAACLLSVRYTREYAFMALYIDTPEINSCAVDLAKRLGLQKVFKTMRMYRGEPLQTQDEKMFGLTALELG